MAEVATATRWLTMLQQVQEWIPNGRATCRRTVCPDPAARDSDWCQHHLLEELTATAKLRQRPPLVDGLVGRAESWEVRLPWVGSTESHHDAERGGGVPSSVRGQRT